MRTLLIAAAFIANTATAAVPFLQATSPEQPVSPRVFGPPAGSQLTLGVATNGQIAFAVWEDLRRGRDDLYGSRIGPDGTVLDPLGILIAPSVEKGSVLWNGTAFVVISQVVSSTSFSFVTPEGVIADRKTMQIDNEFVATLGSGADARFLFVAPSWSCTPGCGDRATILDSQANVVKANVQLPTRPGSYLLAAAGRGSDILLLRTADNFRHIFADRIDRDGKFLGSADTLLQYSLIGIDLALAGGTDEYLAVSRGATRQQGYLAHLDANGTVKSVRNFTPYDSSLRVSGPGIPAVFFDGERYQISWTSEADGLAHTWLASEPAGNDSGVLPLTPIFSWTGTGYRTVITKIGATPIVITDAYRTGVSTSTDPIVSAMGKNTVISSTASSKEAPQVVSSANAYAVLWSEYGPDGSSHLYLRRYSLAGAAIDAAPIEVGNDPTGHGITACIAASGETYVIAWASSVSGDGSNYVLRRFSATTSTWLDPQPVPLATAEELVLAANGDGALAFYTQGDQRALRTRAIATDSGAPLRSGETTPNNGVANELSIAGNGHDYLIAWNDGGCFFYSCDTPIPTRIVALRLRADGSAISQSPIVLDDTGTLPAPDWPSVVWSGNTYVVSWGHDSSLFAAHVSSSGLADAARQIVPRPQSLTFQRPRLVASGNELLLLFTEGNGLDVTMSAIGINSEGLAPTGESALLNDNQRYDDAFSTAAVPGGLVIAYDRIDPAAANVSRVFTRTFAGIKRRRATR